MEIVVGLVLEGEMVGIDVVLRSKVFCCGDVVLCFDYVEVVMDCDMVFMIEEVGVVGVDCNNDVVEGGGDVGLEVDVEFFFDGLRVRIGVLLEEDGILFFGVEVLGVVFKVVEFYVVVDVKDVVF